MTERISLVEAYNNRDVIAQLVRLRDNVDELMNILKDLDPNGDLTNVVTKTGDQTIDGVKTFIGQIVADCDIIQNGAAYETHAEQVYSVNDYIVTRDGQITGLAPGDLSGFHVKKYNGVDDSRLGVDNTGTMRVGDVGQEQPLATRDEAADMVSGAYVRWDGVNQKIIAPDVDTGDDTHPVKFVDGAPVAVANALALASDIPDYEVRNITFLEGSGTGTLVRFGRVVIVNVVNYNPAGTGVRSLATLPYSATVYSYGTAIDGVSHDARILSVEGSTLKTIAYTGDGAYLGQVVYMMNV